MSGIISVGVVVPLKAPASQILSKFAKYLRTFLIKLFNNVYRGLMHVVGLDIE